MIAEVPRVQTEKGKINLVVYSRSDMQPLYTEMVWSFYAALRVCSKVQFSTDKIAKAQNFTSKGPFRLRFTSDPPVSDANYHSTILIWF